MLELTTTQVVLPNISTKALQKKLRHIKKERKERMAYEVEKVDSGPSFKHLKMIADEGINRTDEFATEINDIFHQNTQTWRVGKKLVGQLDEAINSKEVESIKKKRSLEEPILEVEYERQARKVIKTRKYGLDMTLNHLITILDIHYKWELMANQVVSANVSFEAYEN